MKLVTEGDADESGVAPRAGAWIETPQAVRPRIFRDRSRPVRARGLKMIWFEIPNGRFKNFPGQTAKQESFRGVLRRI